MVPKSSKSMVVHKAQSFQIDPHAAISELREKLNCPNMAGVVFFCSVDYDLEALGQELKSTFSCPVVGCTTAGEIGPNGYSDHSITAFSMETENLEIHPFQIPELDKCGAIELEEISGRIKETIRNRTSELPDTKPFGFFLIDGLSLKEEQIIGQLYYTLESLPIVGGSAGGGANFDPTFVYFDGKFLANSALFTLFITSHPFEVFRTQHFVPMEGKLVITKAKPEERLVMEINGRPAAQEYARCLGLCNDDLTSEVLAMHPVMLKLGGEYYVRSVMRKLDDGSLQFACAIDEGLVLTMADGVDIIDNLQNSLDELSNRMNPQVIIGCECFFRKLEVMEKDIRDSISRIMSHHNVIGFHTYGEQIHSVHVNQTFTGVAIGAE